MALSKGKVLRGDGTVPARPIVSEARRTKVAREEHDARTVAQAILARARDEAAAIEAAARARSADVLATAQREAREAEAARFAAAWLALRAREEASAAQSMERTIALARILAERLLGQALALQPELVASLAAQALAEAQGARSARIDAHPADAALLRRELGRFAPLAVTIGEDAALARGSLRLHTDLGTLDAQLSVQLERLAAALREVSGG
jgi:flagellar biosynthesis/type III secretory pathway protein FliH